MRRTSAAVLLCGFMSGGLVAGVQLSAAQSPAPAITVKSVPDAPAPTGAQPAPAAKTLSTGGEVLPWANKPLTPVAALPESDFAAVEAAAAQCSGLFEAACRDLKTCAWVADVTFNDGTLVPARCAARSPVPPKKAAKKSTPAKKKEAAASAPNAQATAVPVVTGSESVPQNTARVVERVDDPPPAPPKKQKPAPKPRIDAKATPAPQKTEKPKEEPEQQAEAAAAPEKPAPSEPKSSPMPSFGSIGGFGGGNAVVVTVPPSSE
ncbi:hypothetical protein [Hyphomicrobium sp. CS1GBMeth3]|uniref:hypothetical protein n=1 Tax=Hyphomicrobium sp. CS1GBMeth3 TaxID=1892845 RepID=UPI001AEC9AF3|nr:hypothetical protein [Hyphomicrobium sp. CS1GBMeth3]